MRGNLAAFKCWAPDGAAWTEWAKPVPFSDMPPVGSGALDLPAPAWITRADPATAVIVDLPGGRGVAEGLALAKIGYRPVPLYNGVSATGRTPMLVPTREVVDALSAGAASIALAGRALRPNAPPAFLLDANRMNDSGKRPGMYDNRWCVFPQDMPSASFLLGKGIKAVILRSDTARNDLKHVLQRYAERGIGIWLHDGNARQNITGDVKPSKFMWLFYRLGVMLGLKRNATGGFGGIIPEVTQHGYGGGRRGFG